MKKVKHDTKQQKTEFSMEDNVGKITMSKNTSQEILNALNKYNFGARVIIKD